MLADGATCDGARLDNTTGIVKLHELTCTDGRATHAVFVSKGGTDLRDLPNGALLLTDDVGNTIWQGAAAPRPRRNARSCVLAARVLVARLASC